MGLARRVWPVLTALVRMTLCRSSCFDLSTKEFIRTLAQKLNHMTNERELGSPPPFHHVKNAVPSLDVIHSLQSHDLCLNGTFSCLIYALTESFYDAYTIYTPSPRGKDKSFYTPYISLRVFAVQFKSILSEKFI